VQHFEPPGASLDQPNNKTAWRQSVFMQMSPELPAR
jgi:hypothetical protein